MSDGMRRELAYLSSHATNRYFIPNWGKKWTCNPKTMRFLEVLGASRLKLSVFRWF